MASVTQKIEIQKTFTSIRSYSYQEKRSPFMNENNLNLFLDRILEFKNKLKQKTADIQFVNERLEQITWLNELDEECLMMLNDLISSARDLRSSLVRQYIAMNFLNKKGIAKQEIVEFKTAIDDLREICDDIESVFFFLPRLPDFLETTKKLSLV